MTKRVWVLTNRYGYSVVGTFDKLQSALRAAFKDGEFEKILARGYNWEKATVDELRKHDLAELEERFVNMEFLSENDFSLCYIELGADGSHVVEVNGYVYDLEHHEVK